MEIKGERIIDVGMDSSKNAYVTLSSGQVLYLDECENETIKEELN